MSRQHRTCHHVAYRLSCEDYDALCADADGRCQVCGEERELLWIDHDHHYGDHPYEGVRGLVCPRCNSHLRYTESGHYAPTRQIERYCEFPWHQRTSDAPARDLFLFADDDLWQQARDKADREDTSVSEAVRAFLKRWVAR